MNNIEIILSDVYGVNVLNAPPEAIIWASDQIPSVEKAKSEISRVNKIRESDGKVVAHVPYGHRAF